MTRPLTLRPLTGTALLALALSFGLGAQALAQDTPAEKKEGEPKDEKQEALDPRIALDATETLDKKAVEPNGLQYFLWERLNFFRFRIDSKRPIGQKKLDAYVAKMDRYWKKKDPEGAQPTDFTLTVKQESSYDAAKFYGEAQAHNYKGSISAELKDADGKVLETFAFSLSWGRLISSGLSKRQVQLRYDQMIHTALAIGILNHPKIKARIPAKFLPELLKWSKKQQEDLLGVLEGSTETLKQGEMAKFVRGVKLEEAK